MNTEEMEFRKTRIQKQTEKSTTLLEEIERDSDKNPITLEGCIKHLILSSPSLHPYRKILKYNDR